MINNLVARLSRWMETSAQHRADAWLGDAADISELERRMRFLEAHGWRY